MSSGAVRVKTLEAAISLFLGIFMIGIAAHFFARKDVIQYLFQESVTIGYLFIAQLIFSVLAALILIYRHLIYFEGSALVEQPPF
jgi:hypothetical protein